MAPLRPKNLEYLSSKITVDGDDRRIGTIEAICQCRCCRFVDCPEYVQNNLPGILRCLPLSIVEVRGDSDDGVLEQLYQSE
jgi:hypothetical protein